METRGDPWRRAHRVRLGNLERFKKNLIKNGSLDKKLGQKENRSVKIFEIEKFRFFSIEFSMKMNSPERWNFCEYPMT